MLGFLLLYFIWKYYSELAFEFDKNKWGYVVLGIASYYLGTFLGGVIIGIVGAVMGSNVEELPNFAVSLMALPFGLLTTWGVYKILQNKWSKENKTSDNESLDSDFV